MTCTRYDRLSLEAYLNGSHFQSCRMPNCRSGQQCFPEDDSYIICQECKGRTCIKCDAVWHSNETCDEHMTRKRKEAESRNAEETASAEYIRSETKTCPSCKAPTYRYAGCDHMTCKMMFLNIRLPATNFLGLGRRCNHQYCWICFADYLPIARGGNAHHREDCTHHTRNLPHYAE